MLEDESRSKMLQKQKDPMMSEKKVNTKPVDYAALNQLSKDFETCFVPQTELSAEQGFWSRDKIILFVKALKDLFNSFDQFLIDELTEVQNVFNQMEQTVEQHCVEKNKFQDKMNNVLKENERLLEQAISADIVNIVVHANVNCACKTMNECERCDNKNVNEILTAELERYKDQVIILKEQNNVDKASESCAQSLEIDNLKHILSKHLKEKESLEQKVTILKNDFQKEESQNIDRELTLEKQKTDAIVIRDYEETLMLEDESRSKMLQKQKDRMMYEKKSRNSVNSEELNLSTSTTIVEVSKELPKVSMLNSSLKKLKFHLAIFDVVFKERTTATAITEAQSKEKDTVIMKLKERLKSLSGNVKEEKIKKELEEIEMINIELDHKVTKLVAENEHLKQTYKKLYDSIKSSRVRSKEQSLKETLSKLKGKAVINEAVTLHPIDPELLKIDVAPLAPKLHNNGTAHNDYLKHTQEETNTLREIVQIERLLNSLNTSFDYAYSRCSKHMTGDRSQLINFVQKFLGTVKFRNDHVAKIMGYGDYKIGNVTISRVYFVEGLWHNLFLMGQFCDSDLEVAFRQHICLIQNLDGVDLLTGSRGNNLYTLSLQDMVASSPICLLSKASKTKSWLWHRRLSHLNFGAINHLARQGLVRESVNGKKYILVIVDDYSRFTWVKCLRSKDEAPDYIIKFLKMIHVRLKVSVRRIQTDNGTEFVNQMLREYYEEVGNSHETSVARSPQQNDVVERHIRMLIEVARTMLIYAQASLFLWAESSSGLTLNEMTPATISLRLVQKPSSSTPYVPPSRNDWDLLFQLISPSSTIVDQDAASPSKSQTTPEVQSFVIPQDVEEDIHDIEVAHMGNDPLFGVPIPEVTSVNLHQR
nr:integrase, catalytic region, zinc finger, CCHC-type, peptidase aspartic, catalytic [Tanacetum cinerariifolium]